MSLESQLDLEIAQQTAEMKEVIVNKLNSAYEAQKEFIESRQEVPVSDTLQSPF